MKPANSTNTFQLYYQNTADESVFDGISVMLNEPCVIIWSEMWKYNTRYYLSYYDSFIGASFTIIRFCYGCHDLISISLQLSNTFSANTSSRLSPILNDTNVIVRHYQALSLIGFVPRTITQLNLVYYLHFLFKKNHSLM